jgi:predicted phage terminase large subunit-like protein
MVAAAVLDLLDAIPIELAERKLRHFVRGAWHIIEPFSPFTASWHLDAIADHLEAVEQGHIRNLLVTMPPRMGKSLTISVFYPAWRWITAPGTRFLYASYSQDLATEHSLGTRRVIESPWYQARWGDRFQLAGDANLKTRFENDQRGARISTSVGGVVTGRGGDRIIVDDAHNVREAESDTIRAATLTWWDQAMSTRFNEPKTGARIVVMQRVHAQDLAGHVLEQGGYVHLNLPMEYEPETVHFTGFGTPDPRTEPGQLLAPERVGPVEIADLKVRLGSRAYAGQFQQRPAPAEGGTFKRSWWQRYTDPPTLVKIEQYLDSAFKTGVGNDYSVIATWGSDGAGNLYVLDVWRRRVEYPDLLQAAHREHAKHSGYGVPVPLVIEDKASGQSAIQSLARPLPVLAGRTLPRLPVVAFPIAAGESKEARAEGVSPLVEAGRVFLPAAADWVDAFIEEHALFPVGAHDDQVDTTSMAIKRLGRVQQTMSWV